MNERYCSPMTASDVREGKDDEVGKQITQHFFSGEQIACFEDIDDLKPRIIKLAGDLLESISEY